MAFEYKILKNTFIGISLWRLKLIPKSISMGLESKRSCNYNKITHMVTIKESFNPVI